MLNVPTLLVRDKTGLYVTSEVTPGCEWVLACECVAQRLWVGRTVKRDEQGRWWAFQEVQRGAPASGAFRLEEQDEVTGTAYGWVPVVEASVVAALLDALGCGNLTEAVDAPLDMYPPGMYELCGPKVKRNPQLLSTHRLIQYGTAAADPYLSGDGRTVLTVDDVIERVRYFAEVGWQGVVWHHLDGRMAKLRAADLPPRPQPPEWDPLVYSGVIRTVDGEQVPYTWAELAEKRRAVIDALLQQVQPLANMVRDLTRCWHGRCAGDACSQCGGTSGGNPNTPLVIGYDIDGREYRVEQVTDWGTAGPVITCGGERFAPRPPDKQ